MVRRHAVILSGLLVAGLTGCSDATPAALDSDIADYEAASRVWQDPWVAPTAAMVAGPGLGTNGWVSRVVGGRTTPYDGAVTAAAAAELAVATAHGWAPTSSACGTGVSIALAGPEGALASLVVRASRGGSEVRVVALTRHHLDDEWSVPDTVAGTCLDGDGGDIDELPELSAPKRSADLPDDEDTVWKLDEPRAQDDALLAEVNADLTAKEIGEIPGPPLQDGENRRRAPGTEFTFAAAGLHALGTRLEGWTLTWTACGGGSPTRATYVRSFENGAAVAHATLIGRQAVVQFTLPIIEGPDVDTVTALDRLSSTPCLGRVDALTVAGTPAVLPTELTPIAD